MSDLKPIRFEYAGPADGGLVIRPTIDPRTVTAGEPVQRQGAAHEQAAE